MGEISTQQIYDLVLDISRDMAELEASIDELLVEMRTLDRETSSGKQFLSEVSQHFSKAFPT